MANKSETAAHRLRKALEGPVYNDVLRTEVGRGALDYEIYVKTQMLLSLQTPMADLVIPDELLFQVVHQAQELWLKLGAFEVTVAIDAMDRNELFAASASFERIVAVLRCLGVEIRILETLSPASFQTIRRQLGNGSGLESPGYSRMRLAADEAEGALARLLEAREATLLDVYTRPSEFPDLHRICEHFVDWDEAFQSWLMTHFLLVRRTIGVARDVRALDGFPTRALAPRMAKPLFPRLWDVRVDMTKGWTREGGFTPGEPRSSRDGSILHRAFLPDDEVMSERGPNSVRIPRR